MLGVGMFSWFSYDLPIKERLQLIKNAGFDATSLWWGDGNKHEQPDMARKIGLQIDNIHTPFNKPDRLWLDGIEGEEYQNMLISCVEDCNTHNISTAVIHLTSFNDKVDVTDLGLKRIGKIVDVAVRKNVGLAFENLTVLDHLNAVFERFLSPHVGFCYDIGHENWKHPKQNCLALYGDRLLALHINDNYGDADTHMLPFDGNIDWDIKMLKLKQCKDFDYFTLEVGSREKYNLSAEEYLNSAYERAVKLLERYYFIK